MHSSLMVSVRGGRVRIDCGADWLGRADERQPAAIFVTHAHPDHAAGCGVSSGCGSQRGQPAHGSVVSST